MVFTLKEIKKLKKKQTSYDKMLYVYVLYK